MSATYSVNSVKFPRRTEASVSTLVRALAAEERVEIGSADGRTKSLRISRDGSRLLRRGRRIMDPQFERLLAAADIDADQFELQLARLLTQLEDGQ